MKNRINLSNQGKRGVRKIIVYLVSHSKGKQGILKTINRTKNKQKTRKSVFEFLLIINKGFKTELKTIYTNTHILHSLHNPYVKFHYFFTINFGRGCFKISLTIINRPVMLFLVEV